MPLSLLGEGLLSTDKSLASSPPSGDKGILFWRINLRSMAWIRLWVQEGIMSQSKWTLEEEGCFVRLLRRAGNSPIHGKICVTETMGYTIQQLAGLLEINQDKMLDIFNALVLKECIKIDDITGIITIVNWKKYQSEYDRTKKYKGLKVESTQKNTPKSTPKSTAPEVEVEVEVRSKKVEIHKDKDRVLETLEEKKAIDPMIAAYWEINPVWCRNPGRLGKAREEFQQQLMGGMTPAEGLSLVKSSKKGSKPWDAFKKNGKNVETPISEKDFHAGVPLKFLTKGVK